MADVADWADEKATALARTAPDACEGDPCGQCQALATSIAAELRAAYERGVHVAQARLNARAKCEQLAADQRGGERRLRYAADVLREEIDALTALLDKEGGGDG